MEWSVNEVIELINTEIDNAENLIKHWETENSERDAEYWRGIHYGLNHALVIVKKLQNGTEISLNQEYLDKYKDNLGIISDAIDRIEEILDSTYYLDIFKQEINKRIEDIKNALLDLEIEKM